MGTTTLPPDIFTPINYDLGYGPTRCSVFGCVNILCSWESLSGDRCFFHLKPKAVDLGRHIILDEEMESLGFVKEQRRLIPYGTTAFSCEEYHNFPLVDTNRWIGKDMKVSIWEEYKLVQVVSYRGQTFCRTLRIQDAYEFLIALS